MLESQQDVLDASGHTARSHVTDDVLNMYYRPVVFAAQTHYHKPKYVNPPYL